MKFPEKGIGKQEIMETLKTYRDDDVDWRSGKIFAYTFHAGLDAEDTVKEAYLEFINENALDPTSFPSLVRLEREVVRMIADLLRGDENVVGNFTSGGTESIMLAVKSARDRARAEKPHIKEPEMIFSRTAHCAFHKSAHYLGIKPVVTDFNPDNFLSDVDSMRDAITENTILLVGSAPSYAQGVVDPIKEIGELALEKDLMFHVDACMGGIMLSVMRDMQGFDIPDFDFSVPGVTSISADMHKFGYALKNASTVLYRNKEIRKHQIFAETSATTYALVNPTLLSSKSGGPMAGAWAMLKYFGREGYEKLFGEVMAGTRKLIDGINATGDLYVLGHPQMCIFSFASDTINVFQLADVMAKQGWYLQPQFSTDRSPLNLHVTMNHSNVPHVDDFLAALPGAIEQVKEGEPLDINKIRAQVQSMMESFGDDAIEQLSAMAGISDSDSLPQEMALISSILDSLPNDVSKELLVEYINDLFV